MSNQSFIPLLRQQAELSRCILVTVPCVMGRARIRIIVVIVIIATHSRRQWNGHRIVHKRIHDVFLLLSFFRFICLVRLFCPFPFRFVQVLCTIRCVPFLDYIVHSLCARIFPILYILDTYKFHIEHTVAVCAQQMFYHNTIL